jgi:hypothetical protein
MHVTLCAQATFSTLAQYAAMLMEASMYQRIRERAPSFERIEHINGVPYPRTVFPSFDMMIDKSGKRARGGRLPSSPCEHVSIRQFIFRPGEWDEYDTSMSYNHSFNHIPTELSFPFVREWMSTHVDWDTVQLANGAFSAFSDQVPADVNFGNFLLEWGEVADILPGIWKSVSLFEEHVEDYRQTARAVRRVPPGPSRVKALANLTLLWDFAIAPLVDDLTKLSNIALTTMKRLERVQALNGRTTRVHFQRVFPNLVPALPPSCQSGRGLVTTLVAAETVFRATCNLQVDLEDVDGPIGFMRALVGTLGLNNPAGIVWNALPFSFILDWLFRFGDFLNLHKVQPFVGEWNVKDLTWSMKYQSQWDVTRTAGFQPGGIQSDRYEAAIFANRYERGVGLPAFSLSDVLHVPPTPGQAKLLLALCVSLS